MSKRLGQILKAQRGSETRLSYAKRLDLSYTFVRSLEEGLRRPSDEVLIEIASKLSLDPDVLLIAAYCDRSPFLEAAIRRRGHVLADWDLESAEGSPRGPLPGVNAPGSIAADAFPPAESIAPKLPIDGVAPPDLPPGRSEF